MRLEPIDHYSCSAGRPWNEDQMGATSNAMWMIDGATSLDPPRLHSMSDSVWLANLVSQQFQESFAEPQSNAQSTTSAVIRECAQRVTAHFPLPTVSSGPLPPAASVGLIRLLDDTVELTLIGDIVIALFTNEGKVITMHEHRSFLEHEYSDASIVDPYAQSRAVRKRRLSYIRGEGHNWVLSNNTDIAVNLDLRTYSALSDPCLAFLCTDGFARAIELFQLAPDWSSLLRAVATDGLGPLGTELRLAERSSLSSTMVKASDDASAMILAIVPDA